MEKLMTETLSFVKDTKRTVVYGNDNIQSLYIPKDKFKTEDYPKEIKVSISF